MAQRLERFGLRVSVSPPGAHTVDKLDSVGYHPLSSQRNCSGAAKPNDIK